MTEHNVTPHDYRDHRSLALAMGNLWENNGWMVWATTAQEHILLWASPYRLQSRPDGPFAVSEAALSQTLLLRCPRSGPVEIDRPFLQRGWEPIDHLDPDSLVVDVAGDRATWQIGARRFEATPPTWHVSGTHADVAVDLELSAMAPAFWFTDRERTVEEIGERWIVQPARATGTITHGSEAIRVDGMACHERHVHCNTRYDPTRLLSARGVTWHSGGVDDMQVLVFTRPSLGLNWSRLILGDLVVDLSTGHDCRIDETSYWVDPKSRISVPSSWQIEITGPSGRLDVEVKALARAYYLWSQLSRGATVLYWWLAEATLRYELADGRSGSYENFTYVVHDNRLLYRDFEPEDWQ